MKVSRRAVLESRGRFQAVEINTTNKTPLNVDNKENVMVLGEEECLDIVWKLQALMGFHVNHQMKMIRY